jgi:hypothetical protein
MAFTSRNAKDAGRNFMGYISYAVDLDSLRNNTSTIKKNTEALIDARKEAV